MNTGETIILVLASIVVNDVSFAEGAYTPEIECDSDDGCPTNMFCYHTKTCAACIKCSNYLRQERSQSPKCAKEIKDCGDCQPGYEEKILTTGESKFTCERKSTSETDESPQSTSISTEMLVSAVLGVFLVMTFAVFIIFMITRGKKKKEEEDDEKVESGTSASAPFLQDLSQENKLVPTPLPYNPYFVPEIKTERVLVHTVDEGVINNGWSTPRTRSCQLPNVQYTKMTVNKIQKTIPFRVPARPYNSRCSSEENAEQDIDEIHEEYVVTLNMEEEEDHNIHLDDEETLESTWTPPLNYGQSSSRELPTQDDAATHPPLSDPQVESGTATENRLFKSIFESSSFMTSSDHQNTQHESSSTSSVTTFNDSGISTPWNTFSNFDRSSSLSVVPQLKSPPRDAASFHSLSLPYSPSADALSEDITEPIRKRQKVQRCESGTESMSDVE